jgi:hypothetical protein
MDFASPEDESAGMRGFVSLVTMLGVLLVGSGCGGGDSAAEPGDAARSAAPVDAVRLPQTSSGSSGSARPSALRTPAGFRMRRVGEAGVQIALPRGWIALARRDAVFPGVAQTLLRVDGGIRPALAALSFPDSPMKLLVLAPSRGGRGFPATVSLVVSGATGAPTAFAEWAPGVERSLVATARPHRGKVASRRVRLAVGAGLRSEFEQRKSGRRIAVVQYTALAGGQTYIVRLTTTPGRLASVVRDFDRLAPTLASLAGTTAAQPSAPSSGPATPGLSPAA